MNPMADAQLQSAFQSGNLGQALQISMQILQQDPNHAEANLTLARIRYRQGILDEAIAAAQKALAARPDHELTMLLMGDIEGRRGQTSEALAWSDRTLAIHPGSVPARYQQASLLERAGEWQKALEVLASPEMSAPNPNHLVIEARCHLSAGETEKAMHTIDQAVALPGMDLPQNAPTRTRLLLLRSKVLDQLGRYDEAFTDANTANRIVPTRFDPDEYVAGIDEIIRVFTAERIGPPGNGPLRHVFISGMPRSGTTLLEQIIDAHPGGSGAGEAKEFMMYAARLQQMLGAWGPFPACVDSLKPEKAEELAKAYEVALGGQGVDTECLMINKNLANLKLAGLIAMILPDARFIFTTRDPRDVGISCFMGNFSSNVFPELQDLDHIALAIRQHDRLRSHWKNVLGARWIEVAYEDMVNDQENQTRSILEFCGLPWNDDCLQFHESGRTVMTLSYDQVNKPLYASSAGRHRNYESHLGPLQQLIDE